MCIKIILMWMVENDRSFGYLCGKAGLSPECLVNLITGYAMPIPQELAALEQAMDLPAGQLLRSNALNVTTAYAPDPLRCFTVREVAERMKVHEGTVRKEMEQGILGWILVGERARRIPEQALEERLSRWTTP